MKPLTIVKESRAMRMRTRRPAMPEPSANSIKLRIDSKTTIMVRSEESMQMWMKKYPNAKVVL
jgi:hypothetical protein